MSINLSVPYKSQWDADAVGTNNDCGPASIAMILNYYGENLTTDQVFRATGAGQGLISFLQMKKAIESFGYVYHEERNTTPDRIYQLLQNDTPPIALVHYGSLESTQDKNFKGGHFFVIVGMRDDGYFVNDPNFRGEYRSHGDHHNYTKNEFEKAWRDCSKDTNPINTLIWIERKCDQKLQRKIATLETELNNRQAQVARLNGELDNKSKVIRGLTESIDEQQEQYDVLYKLYDESQKTVGRLNNKIEELKQNNLDGLSLWEALALVLSKIKLGG